MSEAQKTIVCFGPGPQFKGGISNYNTSLAKALHRQGAKVHIVSWTQQYPAIIPRDFIDRSSKNDFLEGTDITCTYLTNYNNPFSWQQTVSFIKGVKPDMVIFQWAIALQGLPMGYMARRLKNWGKTEVIFDCHLVVQKESSSLDAKFSKYGLAVADTYLTHAYRTVDELKATFPDYGFGINETGKRFENKPTVIKLYHPVYDLFKPKADFDLEAEKKALGLKKNVFLFFGFIRKYKGLHQAIEAFNLVRQQRDDVSLLVVGESFWNTLDANKWSTRLKKKIFGTAKSLFLKNTDNEQDYNPLARIDELQVKDVVVVNKFVPNEEVHRYFQVSDCVLLFYLTATPSGVESLTYNFKIPVLATRVGHFPETIKEGFNGYLANDRDVNDIARVMNYFLDHPIAADNIEKSAVDMSWDNYAKAILSA